MQFWVPFSVAFSVRFFSIELGPGLLPPSQNVARQTHREARCVCCLFNQCSSCLAPLSASFRVPPPPSGHTIASAALASAAVATFEGNLVLLFCTVYTYTQFKSGLKRYSIERIVQINRLPVGGGKFPKLLSRHTLGVSPQQKYQLSYFTNTHK